MNKRNLILVICCVFFALTSCQKEEIADLTIAARTAAHHGGGDFNGQNGDAPIFPAPCVDSTIPFILGTQATMGVSEGIFIQQNNAYTGQIIFYLDQITYTYTPDNGIAYTTGAFADGPHTSYYLNVSPFVKSPNSGELVISIPYRFPMNRNVYYLTFTYCLGDYEMDFCSEKAESQHTIPCPGDVDGGPGVTFTVIMSVTTQNIPSPCC